MMSKFLAGHLLVSKSDSLSTAAADSKSAGVSTPLPLLSTLSMLRRARLDLSLLAGSPDLFLPLKPVLLTPAVLLFTLPLLDLPLGPLAFELPLAPVPELCGGTYTYIFVILTFCLFLVGISIDCASVL